MWILHGMNETAKNITEERESSRSTQIVYESCNENTMAITQKEAKTKSDPAYTLYTALDSTLRMLHPFMPFVAEEFGSGYLVDLVTRLPLSQWQSALTVAQIRTIPNPK